MTEVHVLGLSALLWVVQLTLASIAANRQIGMEYFLTPRDEKRELHGQAGRLKRAFDNHGEGLVVFTAAVVTAALLDATNAVTAACAWVYLGARILYVPAYVFGWVPWRTVVWTVGFAATTLLLLVALLA